ncbi:MAG TPA: c-type cytochrome [Verrucomicrobiota bacterium]|nr:c-type cytochrome [Verrucomicrobiota bacterium]HNU53063.1 c-type cytochrome [Verrucomicrobiota bacterium]
MVFPGIESSGDTVHAGAVLLKELRCTACHTPAEPARPENTPSPAPNLATVGQRIRIAALERHLAEPHSLKPGSTMPDLLRDLPPAEKNAAANDLLGLLLSLAPPPAEATDDTPTASPDPGRLLYHRAGCVACHAPQETAAALFPDLPATGPADPEAQRFVLDQLTLNSIPLGDLRQKYLPAALTRLLLDPLSVRSAGRMPSLNLSPAEAQAIAAYLQRDVDGATPASAQPSGAPPSATPHADRIRRGRDRFAALGCAACHTLDLHPPRLVSRLEAPPLDRLRADAPGGCLSATPRQGVPRYAFHENQRTALRTLFSATQRQSPPSTPLNRVAHTLASLNCLACHSREGLGGPSPSRSDFFVSRVSADWGDEGRLPPHLSGVGRKLRTAWLREVVLNRGAVRPYLATRMPQFGAANVEPLIADFVLADAPPTPAPEEPAPRDAATGRLLVGTGGCSCIVCHDFAGIPSLGLSVMDMTWMSRRLHYDWFRRYLLDPAGLRPGTRMPAFWPEAEATIKTLLDGNTERQIHAIWSFLSLGASAQPPPGLETSPTATPP